MHLHLMSRLFLCLVLPIFVALPAHAAGLSRSYSYFSVGGSTIQEIYAQLVRRGPTVESTGQKHAGATRMDFKENVTLDRSGGRCRIAKADITLVAKIILPRWTARSSGSQETRVIWDALAADIKRHEDDHVKIARRHAGEMESALRRLPAARDCKALEKAKAQAIARQMKRHDAEQARFERRETRGFEKRLERLVRQRMAGG